MPLRRYDRLKRAIDVVGSIVGLLVGSPFLLVIAAAIRARMGAPVLFRQPRPGLHGELFTLYKFRTMTSGDGPDAERLTRLGRVLRAASLDELPELWNVLRGDMSLVGPRPLLPEYLERFNAEQQRRHDVKPGITGYAQVAGRNALDWSDRLALDIWYVENRSTYLDLIVLARTVPAVMRRRGISAPGHATMPSFDEHRGPPLRR